MDGLEPRSGEVVGIPYRITEACTACGECLPVCPIDAIEAGDPIYVIDQELCVDFEECLPVCPEDAIVQVEQETPLRIA